MRVHRRYWTREWIIDACREWANLYGAPPRAEDWQSTGPGSRYPSQTTVKARFGTWSAMVVAAGFEPRNSRTASLYWTPELVLAACNTFVEKHGRAPLASEWRKATSTTPNSWTVIRRFGSWNAMIAACGLEPRPAQATARWTREEIAASMLDSLLRNGRWPTSHEWQLRTSGNPSYQTVLRAFGTWNAAKRFAGWDGTDPRKGRKLAVVSVSVEAPSPLPAASGETTANYPYDDNAAEMAA